jgi:hypothetical protein
VTFECNDAQNGASGVQFLRGDLDVTAGMP